MIFEVLLKGIVAILKGLANMIKLLFPSFSIPIQLGEALGIILSTTSQANNFIHFMLGDTAYILIPSIIALTIYKYAVYPIITTLLGIIINKAN